MWKLCVCLARDDPQALVILLNEEIVVIDLVTDNWPSYHLPYLNSIHASPVICTTLVCSVNPEFYKRLVHVATIQYDDYSDRVSQRKNSFYFFTTIFIVMHH